MREVLRGLDTATLLRRSMLALAGAGVVGTSVELATLRHWQTTTQLIPWVVLGVLGMCVIGLATGPSAQIVRIVRMVACFAVLSGLYGIFIHVKSNYDVAILDYHYTDRWPHMSFPAKLWAAGTGQVGPSPVVAPGVLTQCAICIVLATARHPRLTRVPKSGLLAEIDTILHHGGTPVGSLNMTISPVVPSAD